MTGRGGTGRDAIAAAVRRGGRMRIIIGAGDQRYDGWIPTQREDLDLLDERTWASVLPPSSVDALLCEHVLEHLTVDEGRAAARICYRYLEPGGYLRCAVPDGNFRDADYMDLVRVDPSRPAGHPAADHKVLYTFDLLQEVLEAAGFRVSLLEWCDGDGAFHARPWDSRDGPIYRSLHTDHRNEDGQLRFVSLIVDACKPTDPPV